MGYVGPFIVQEEQRQSLIKGCTGPIQHLTNDEMASAFDAEGRPLDSEVLPFAATKNHKKKATQSAQPSC